MDFSIPAFSTSHTGNRCAAVSSCSLRKYSAHSFDQPSTAQTPTSSPCCQDTRGVGRLRPLLLDIRIGTSTARRQATSFPPLFVLHEGRFERRRGFAALVSTSALLGSRSSSVLASPAMLEHTTLSLWANAGTRSQDNQVFSQSVLR